MRVAPPRLRIALALLCLAAAGGMTAAIAQGDDPPAAATFKTVDGSNVFQLVTGSGSQTSADILTGGTVTFTNASVATHNVDFFTAAAQTAVSCQQTLGGTSPSPVRVPGSPASGDWAGVCTFSKAGTYSFTCDHHPFMTGTVVVHDPAGGAGTTTTTTPPVTVTTTTPTQTTPSGSPPATTAPTTTPTTSTPVTTTASPVDAGVTQTPRATAKALSVRVSLAQRGARLRGTVNGARSSARVRVSLTARRGDLGLRGKAGTPVAVGSLSALTTASGALSFLIRLDGRARAALVTRGRLAVTMRVTAPPVTGSPTPRTYRVVVRPSGA
jgi:plastocyanin